MGWCKTLTFDQSRKRQYDMIHSSRPQRGRTVGLTGTKGPNADTLLIIYVRQKTKVSVGLPNNKLSKE